MVEKKSKNGKEAISLSGTLENVDEKFDYLINQANAFYKSKQYQDVIDVAQYILTSVDKGSEEAKMLLEKAKTALSQAAKDAAMDVKNTMGMTNNQ